HPDRRSFPTRRSSDLVQLVAPPVQAAGGGKQFPADPTAGNPSFQSTVYPLLTTFCSGCHTSSSSTAQQPYFASSNINEAYAAAQDRKSTRLNSSHLGI